PSVAAPPIAPTTSAPSVRSTNGNTFEERVRTRSSPLVRKIAAEHGLDIAALQGSGIAGRVTKKDIIGFIESGAAAPGRLASTHAPGRTEVPRGPRRDPCPGDPVEPMSKM